MFWVSASLCNISRSQDFIQASRAPIIMATKGEQPMTWNLFNPSPAFGAILPQTPLNKLKINQNQVGLSKLPQLFLLHTLFHHIHARKKASIFREIRKRDKYS